MSLPSHRTPVSSRLLLLRFLSVTKMMFTFPHTFYMSGPYQHPSFDLSNNYVKQPTYWPESLFLIKETDTHTHTQGVEYFSDPAWTTRVWSPEGELFCPLCYRVQTGCGASQPPIQWGVVGSYFGGKMAQAWSWPTHLHLAPRLRMRGAIPPLPNTSSCRSV
jgi:hypothetical protein